MSRHICGYAVDEHFVFNFADVNIIVCILALILKAISSNIVVLHGKKTTLLYVRLTNIFNDNDNINL